MIKDFHACTIAHMYTHCLTDSSYKHIHMTVRRVSMINKNVRRNTYLKAQERELIILQRECKQKKNVFLFCTMCS